ncbi:MAG: diaminopimelate epimerase [Phycisphaerae bacterium]|jgi:diaminopimelate epimerase
MRFVKLQGSGNDYVYIDGFHQRVEDPADLARAISDRHFGVGSDGLILILPSTVADVRMRIFNADGSEAEMCGNGVRCVAKYAYDHGLAKANPLRVETAAGVKAIELAVGPDGKVAAATVDMGEPILQPRQIPVAVEADRAVNVPISAGGMKFRMTCVSMGNPHAVLYVDDVEAVELERLGPELERHAMFPRRANIHFVQVHSAREVTVRTWERGSGATLACGTGAAAVCVAGVLTGQNEREITLHAPGGDLSVTWRQDDNHVYLTGPAVEVFSGDWPA